MGPGGASGAGPDVGPRPTARLVSLTSRCPQGTQEPDAERLRKLLLIIDAALSHLSLDALLDELLTRIRDVLDADTAAVLLLDDDSKELVARAAKGLEEAVERGVRIPLGLGFAGGITAEAIPVVLEDVEHSDVLNPILRDEGRFLRPSNASSIAPGRRILNRVLSADQRCARRYLPGGRPVRRLKLRVKWL